MELQIVGKNLEITKAIENYLQKKLSKLIRYLPDIDEAKAEINEEQTRSPEHRFTVQVTIKVRGTILRGEEKGSNINIAIDDVVESLARQVNRYKGKLQSRKRSSSLAKYTLVSEPGGAAGEAEISPEVVKTKRFKVRLMTVDEATEQMELLNHDFFIFLNVDSGTLNLVYRRRDGNYGLIEPELAK